MLSLESQQTQNIQTKKNQLRYSHYRKNAQKCDNNANN